MPVKRIKAHDTSYGGTTTKYLRPNGGCSISGPQLSVLSTPQILDPSMKYWYQYRTWNLTHIVQLRESRYITYYTMALLPNTATQWRMVHFGAPRVGFIYTPDIGPIDEGLISISPWNLTHKTQLRESMHMTYHTAVLIQNSCSPIAEGPFRDPKGRSYRHPKY